MIPVCEPTLLGNAKKYVTECLDTNWISANGRFIDEFEKKFAEFCNVRHGVSCNNGTSALHLALAAIGIGQGDEVIVPDFTMIASVNAIIYTGAKPVFVDADKETWCIDPAKIEEKLTKRTKAIMPVHIYGHPCDMDRIKEISKKRGIRIIEDAAEAHGAEYKNKRCGSLGDVAAFSFYGNKIITTGEGGMVVTDDVKIAEKAKELRNHCFGKGDERFTHRCIGFNYRMTNIQAAIGLSQIENADELVNARIRNARLYNSFLSKNKVTAEDIILPPEKPWAKNAYWMYGIVLKDSVNLSRDEIMAKLLKEGIESRSFFMPMHSQPCFMERKSESLANLPDCSGDYPVSELLSKRGLYLPSSSSLTKEQILKVCDALAKILKKA